MIDGNGKDGACLDGTPGAYTLRGNRLSNNARHGYWHWRMKDAEDTPREIVLEGNDIFGNGGDGIRFDREVIDACLFGNRIRRNAGSPVALGAQMPGLWREANRESWSAR